jgi:Rps23 Pro-64 3,4-dihydroxylase Tpa1-like proline 4-hydroxylase
VPLTPLDLSAAVSRPRPFPCFTVDEVISEELEQALLVWLESEAPWRLAVMDFYEQYEFDFEDVELPSNLKPLFSENTLLNLRQGMEALLGASLRSHVEITAHRLKRSQRIRIHNDARPDGETHRFLIQLNRGWTQEHGGLLMLFRGPQVETLDDIILPTSRSAFGFEISTASYHAVSQVHQGDRYTIVFSFYAERPSSRPRQSSSTV